MASRSNPLTRWRYRVEYACYALGKLLYGSLPASWLRRFAPLIGRIGFVVNRRHRRVALENLELAYPQLGEKERIDLGRSCFEGFGYLFTDFLLSSRLGAEDYLERFEVEGLHHLESAEAFGKGVLLLTGHLGNWEALAQYLALTGHPVSFVARPLDNPYLEGDFRRLRERFGNRSIAKRRAARGSLKVLRRNGRVGILMDQRVHPNEGKAYPFFGKPAYTTSLPARLSLKTGAPAVPVFGIPIGDWQRCRIVIHPPVIPDPGLESSEAAIDRLTMRYLQTIEQTIRQHPELWLWMHRKWRQFDDRGEPVFPADELEESPAQSLQDPRAERLLSRSSRRA